MHKVDVSKNEFGQGQSLCMQVDYILVLIKIVCLSKLGGAIQVTKENLAFGKYDPFISQSSQ